MDYTHKGYTSSQRLCPFYVLVIYAPDTSGQHRSQFFDQLFDLLHSPTLDINFDRLVITGDFNYSYQRSHLSSQTSLQWVSFLDDHFYNALQKDDLHELPTFRRNDHIFSTIDYIFVSQSWCSKVTESNIHKLDASWSYRSLLSITCCIGSSPSGPGLWRENPLLARNPAYQQYLRQHLEDIIPKLPSEWSPAKSWDHIKRQVKQLTRTFAVDYTNWRTKTIRKLQSNRNKFLRSKPPLAIRLHQLPIFDQQIASLQQELTDILALKASVRWQEAGETSIKYLKSIYRKRTVEQHITTLQSDDSEDPVEGTDQLLPITQQFYQSLYDADPVDDLQLDSCLQGISDLPQVTSAHCDVLMAPNTIDEIIQETARVQNKISSPRKDGLGYAFLYQLFRYPPLQELVLKVYNQAHNTSIFPHSWQELRVRLLAKKGDLTNLKNWRPISLINCDAKIYTKVLNSRLQQVIPSLINRCQTGFMPNRFIAENGLVLNIIMEHARKNNRQEIALLLDQEKSYDRVHPSYLRSVLLQFGFPMILVNSLAGLLFGNQVRVNINGHFTDEITQSRGLRQGDPSRGSAVASSVQSRARTISKISDPNPSPALKVLAYADDVCVFLSSPTDFLRLQHHLQTYGQVSNAKVNLSKTEAIFLNGKSSNQWQQLLTQHQILKWHDHTKSQPLRYLGFPVIQSTAQRRYVEDHLLQNLKTQCSIYSQRHLSLRGRVTVTNTLLLSKLWYSLSVISLPKSFFRQIRSAIYQFISKSIKPGFRYALFCQPLSKGGLGLLDPFIQHRSLQVRWPRLLFTDDFQSSYSQVYLKDFIRRFHSSGTSSLLSCFFPALRSTTDVSVGSFLPVLYNATDSFLSNGIPEVQCNPATVMSTHLLAVLGNPGWPLITKSSPLQITGKTLFYIRSVTSKDTANVGDRLTASSSIISPLTTRFTKSYCNVTDYPFVTWLTRSLEWVSFCPRVYRQTQLDSMLPCPDPIIPSDGWLRFWNLTILPEARSFCFRFIHGKLHSQSSVARFNPDISAICKFCNVPPEDISHLLVEYPYKWSIWQEALSRFAPHLEFQSTDILTLLLHHTRFDYIDNTTLLRLSYYILLFLWRAHWRYIFDNVPLLPERIVTTAFEKIGMLSLH
ncbi:hypothetical protein G6F17_011128 [Rhizopus arrhizus]|nr:hypothetical protein G6F20_011246 [Rhizopus arrhizus]KAG0849029.1 hypothetical protein G6F17_011128 [Rhizopus arrhizus]